MASALTCFLVLVIVALSGATTDETETDSTTTTTMTSTTITSTTTLTTSTLTSTTITTSSQANETGTSVTVSTTTESDTATHLGAAEASTTASNETTTTTTRTAIANDTSTTQTQPAVANETTTTQTRTVVATDSTTTQTGTVVVNETSTTQTEAVVLDETTTTHTSATRSTFTTVEGTSLEAISRVQGLVTLSVSSAADAEELAGDEGVVEGWRAAFARAADVAVDRVELKVSVVAGRRLRSMRGLTGDTSAGAAFGWGRAATRVLAAAARLTLEYAITQVADSEAVAKTMAGQVVANIAELTEEDFTATLAQEVEGLMGGSGPAVQVETIEDPTEEIVFRLITATETTTQAESGTPPANQERSRALSMAPGAHQVLTTVAVLLWSL